MKSPISRKRKDKDSKIHATEVQRELGTSWSTELAAVATLRGLDRDGQLLELESIQVRCWLNALQCCANSKRIGTAYFLPVERLLRTRAVSLGETRIPVTAQQLERYSSGPSVPRIRKVQAVSALLPATSGIFENQLWQALEPAGQVDDTMWRISGEILGSMKGHPAWLLGLCEPPNTWSLEEAEKALKIAFTSTKEDRLSEILARLDPLGAVGYSVCLFRIAVTERGDHTRCAMAVVKSIVALELVRWAKPLMVRIFDYFWWVLAADESLSGTQLRDTYPLLRSDLVRRSQE